MSTNPYVLYLDRYRYYGVLSGLNPKENYPSISLDLRVSSPSILYPLNLTPKTGNPTIRPRMQNPPKWRPRLQFPSRTRLSKVAPSLIGPDPTAPSPPRRQKCESVGGYLQRVQLATIKRKKIYGGFKAPRAKMSELRRRSRKANEIDPGTVWGLAVVGRVG
ncbi:hypothetical protein BO78DRAFT_29944 [Aspergillus sclerotiicarbonarius CBS 121057]|uniref:Uncharacterized protein n=1 Tax=Aspergillus sclerotiicarbonarius (strain CBS 121057 / IBT 28362) TaxID=1448318 RepID=A0A319DT05_ASPSB|nr:hypothetical protein BO78DRAFT_29944 [Aspergillus sclerotiicarbonarius CBS 121057]